MEDGPTWINPCKGCGTAFIVTSWVRPGGADFSDPGDIPCHTTPATVGGVMGGGVRFELPACGAPPVTELKREVIRLYLQYLITLYW